MMSIGTPKIVSQIISTSEKKIHFDNLQEMFEWIEN